MQERIAKFEDKAVKAGFLLKQGHRFKTWKKRWFVLRGRWLMYLKKPTDAAPAGACHGLLVVFQRECVVSSLF